MQAVRQAVESSWRPLRSVVDVLLSDLIKEHANCERPTPQGTRETRRPKT